MTICFIAFQTLIFVADFQMRMQDILSKPGRSSFFINFRLKEDVATSHAKRDFALFCTYYLPLLHSIKTKFADSALKCCFGISYDFWKKLYPNSTPPQQLKKFEEISGEAYSAPSTEGDFFLHIRAEYPDACYEVLTQLLHFLNPFLENIYEIHGFNSSTGRGVIGFVDGTANSIDEETANFAIVGDEDPEYSGGSYLFTQQYLHDMDVWQGLAVEEQEKIIGKRKFDDLALYPENKYSNAHNVVTQIPDVQGKAQKILRANVIFSNPSQNEFGTFFISYSRTFEIVEKMLNNMFLGIDKGGEYDKLLEFCTAVTGTLFFAPSLELIEKFAHNQLD